MISIGHPICLNIFPYIFDKGYYMKTLIISYLPRGERSNTKKVLDVFIEEAKNKHAKLEILDLTKDVPDFFLPENLSAYYERNYGGAVLSKEKAKSLEKMDRMTKQLKEADFVVLAFPMYNFSVPAIVKAWFDSVLLKGETWDMNESGFAGLMKGKKALVIMSSGGVYEGAWASNDHAMTLAKAEFVFMGYDVHEISAQGVNMMVDKTKEIIERCQSEAKKVAKEWYK